MVLKTFTLIFLVLGCSNGQLDLDSTIPRLARFEAAKPRENNIDYRLPGLVVPIHYDIRLQPNFSNNNFTGLVIITVRAAHNTTTIVLHKELLDINANAIQVHTVTKPIQDMVVVKAESIGVQSQSFYEITCLNTLQKDVEYELIIPEFRGILSETANTGFYIAKYKDAQGIERKFATTHFEPTSARRAFPCFDEPALKATFSITVVRPLSYQTVSNTPQIRQKSLYNGLVKDTFAKTLPMSTYLIAIIVSEYQLTRRVFRQRVLAKGEDIQEGRTEYALTKGEPVLKTMEDFVGIMYAFKKIDQAAIPDPYFSAGAMENWGLVTYRESILLYKEGESQPSSKQQCITVIAHEYGHQWFGNLVSPAWWRYLWLNEGFATYFQYFAAAPVEPTMRLPEQFVVQNTQGVFQMDARNDTRDMNMDVQSPNEIGSSFDFIAYQKAGSVIRMMEAFVTLPVFQAGLNLYLQKRAFKEATPSDLYSSIQEAVSSSNLSLFPNNLTIAKIMKTWDTEKGFPLISIERQYGKSSNNVVVTEIRYMVINDTSIDKGKWITPINFATKSNPSFDKTTADFWIEQKKTTLTLDVNDNDWVIANKKETGYYRVKYDIRNCNLLIDALITNLTSIHLLNRAQIIDDFYNLAKSGHLPYSIPLSLRDYIKQETDYIPLYAYSRAITYLDQMLAYTSVYTHFQAQQRQALEKVYKYLTFDEKPTDEHTDKLNRANVIYWMCYFQYSDCLIQASKKYKDWKSGDLKAIAINLDFETYCGAMRNATQDDWNYLFQQYKLETNVQKRSRMLRALGCTKNEVILEKYFEKINSSKSDPTPNQILLSVINGSPKGTEYALNYLKRNFAKVSTFLSESEAQYIVYILASQITTDSQLNQLKELANTYTTWQDVFNGAIVTTNANIGWLQTNIKQFVDYYRNFSRY